MEEPAIIKRIMSNENIAAGKANERLNKETEVHVLNEEANKQETQVEVYIHFLSNILHEINTICFPDHFSPITPNALKMFKHTLKILRQCCKIFNACLTFLCSLGVLELNTYFIRNIFGGFSESRESLATVR